MPIKKEIKFNEIEYESISDLAKVYNLDGIRVATRLNDNWSIEEALELVPRRTQRTVNREKKKASEVVFYKDKKYPNLKTFCQEKDLNYRIFKSRLSARWDFEVAMKASTNDEFTLNDVRYNTLGEFVDAIGISTTQYSTYRKKGMSVEEIVSFIDGKKQEFRGEFFKSEREIAIRYGIDYPTYMERKLRGWTREEALELVARTFDENAENKKLLIPFRNEKFYSIQKISDTYNVPYSGLRGKLKEGLSLEEAVSFYENKKPIIVEEKIFNTDKEVALYYGKNVTIYMNRLRKGYTREESLELVNSDLINVYVLEEKEYKHQSEIARAYNMSEQLLNSRLKKGWTLEEAVGLAKKYTRAKQMINEEFGKLRVDKFLYIGRDRKWYYSCTCTCGEVVIACNDELTNKTISCCENCKTGKGNV